MLSDCTTRNAFLGKMDLQNKTLGEREAFREFYVVAI